MTEDQEALHLTHYVVAHFRHLMSEPERLALEAIVLGVNVPGEPPRWEVTFRGTVDAASEAAARALLSEGMQALRQRVAQRLAQEHPADINANACPKCGRLPRTPKARQCPWCKHSWHPVSPRPGEVE